ncbi:MAG: CoA ester lyase, partial [Acidimicrobiia bacterium]|nr:CoA ester lyase [Acidimicrobiia bacterium]
RSYLYVPGDRAQVLAKAPTRGADALIVDLEDAVPLAAKEAARSTVAAWLAGLEGEDRRPEVWVRVNNHPDLLARDLEAVGSSPALAGVVIPKVDGPEVLEEVDRILPDGVAIQVMVETARGVLVLPRLAKAPRVLRLQLGEADLSADLGMTLSVDGAELAPVRLEVVIASAAAGLERPVAPVSTDYRDLASFEASTLALRRLGFGARAAIHPAQVAVINRAFTPSDDEVMQARELLDRAEGAAAAGTGVFLDSAGRMVDEAVLRAARQTLALAEQERRR